ncbi:MAG TPA: polysaccharide deacetylase family protein, partial [Bacteroidota bacterium]|nr:polysaccharide deacetylase family protein [Bacteroidota bacterium]
REVAAAGHTIGNHGFSHSHLRFKRRSFIEKEITDTSSALCSIAERTTAMFRPPYGDISFSLLHAARSTQHKIVLWTRDTRDWFLPSEWTLQKYLQRTTREGDIILFHDNELTAARLNAYLPKAIESLSAQHFEFSPLSL